MGNSAAALSSGHFPVTAVPGITARNQVPELTGWGQIRVVRVESSGVPLEKVLRKCSMDCAFAGEAEGMCILSNLHSNTWSDRLQLSLANFSGRYVWVTSYLLAAVEHNYSALGKWRGFAEKKKGVEREGNKQTLQYYLGRKFGRLVNIVGPWGRATESQYSLIIKLHIRKPFCWGEKWINLKEYLIYLASVVPIN